MQDKPTRRRRTNAEEDRREQRAVLAFILDTYPTQLRMADVLRELVEDMGDFESRDRIERAVRELISAGLLFRCEAMVLPTRAAIYVDQLQQIGG